MRGVGVRGVSVATEATEEEDERDHARKTQTPHRDAGSHNHDTLTPGGLPGPTPLTIVRLVI